MKYILIIITLLISQFFYGQQQTETKEEKLYKLNVKYAQVLYRDYEKDSITPIMKSLSDAIYSEPNNPHAYWVRGKIKWKLGDSYGALKDFSTAIEKDTRHINAYYGRAMVKSEMQDWMGANNDLDKVIDIFLDKEIVEWGDITTENLIYNKGICMIQLGNIEGACQLFSAAGEMGDAKSYEAIQKWCN